MRSPFQLPGNATVSNIYLCGTHKWLARHQASAAALRLGWDCPKSPWRRISSSPPTAQHPAMPTLQSATSCAYTLCCTKMSLHDVLSRAAKHFWRESIGSLSAAALLQLATLSDAIVEWVCPKERHRKVSSISVCGTRNGLARHLASATAHRLGWDCLKSPRRRQAA